MRRAAPIAVSVVALVLIVILIIVLMIHEGDETETDLSQSTEAIAEVETESVAPEIESSPTPSPTPTVALSSVEVFDPYAAFLAEEIVRLDDFQAWNVPQASAVVIEEESVDDDLPDESTVGAESLQEETGQTSSAQATESPPPVAVSGAVSAYIADPIYLADGRWAEVYITVTNNSVEPFLRTGWEYVQPNPDGAHQRVTLLMITQDELPRPILGGEPLWLGHIRLSDESWWTFPVGCFYIEDIFAEGMEGDFHWQAHYTGGFFDCGNSTDKIVPPIAPGQTATIPLYVYLQHPRLWGTEPPPGRSISQINLEVFDAYGNSLGIVASRSFGQ